MMLRLGVLCALAAVSNVASAVESGWSLNLQFGPALSPPPSQVTERKPPAYDFAAEGPYFEAGKTRLTISVFEHLAPVVFELPPGAICYCLIFSSSPNSTIFSFAFDGTAPTQYDFLYRLSNAPAQVPFSESFDGQFVFSALGAIRGSVAIGEFETLPQAGTAILTRFAADFWWQYLDGTIPEFDPVTGLRSVTPILTERPGEWYAGSLRYNTGTPAFALLSPVPEPGAFIWVTTGLLLLIPIGTRRRRAQRIANAEAASP